MGYIIRNTYRIAKLIMPGIVKDYVKKFVLKCIYWFRLIFNCDKQTYYGQVGEDAFLRHYLKNKEGFYLDIGAFSPRKYSNTYYFYEKGWRGINIDATPGSMKKFNIIRKRDINIEELISDTDQIMDFYTWPQKGMNTLSKETAKRFEKKLNTKPTVVQIRSKRLETVLDQLLPQRQRIDFMSVDVEGAEMKVLKSNNWGKYRPGWIVVEILEKCLAEVEISEIFCYLLKMGYSLFAWMPPNAYFKDAKSD